MPYVDGFVMAVAAEDKDRFIAFAKHSNPVLKELGAIRSIDCWGDDIPSGTLTDFCKAVNAKDHEAIVFSWVEWPDKETRDRGMSRLNELARTDDRFDSKKHPVPFDSDRMIVGRFETIVEI